MTGLNQHDYQEFLRCSVSELRPQNFAMMMDALSLKDFIIPARVLKLYRSALRISGRAPSHVRAELRQTMRREMETNRDCKERQQVHLLAKGYVD